MHKILPILKEDITIQFDRNFEEKLQIDPIKSLMPLLAAKTNKLEYKYHFDLNKFNDQFPSFINGIQSIILYSCTKSMMNLLVEWLTAQSEDEKPKILEIFDDYQAPLFDLVTRVKYWKWPKYISFFIIVKEIYKIHQISQFYDYCTYKLY